MSDNPAIRLDPYQTAAVESDANTVVTAGAGSGKTLVLSQRFVRLVKEQKAEVDGILTLTFTRKAAMEMNQRIYRDLQKAGCTAALQHFDRGSISTLDSFCARVVKSGSLGWGISPSFTQDIDACRILAREHALGYLTAHQDHPALRALVEVMTFQEVLEELLVPWVLYHGSMVSPLNPDKAMETWKNHVSRCIESHTRSMEEIIHGGRAAADESSSLTAGAGKALSLLDRGEELLDQFRGGASCRESMDFLQAMGKMKKPQGKKEPADLYFKEVGTEAWNAACEGLFLALASLNREEAQYNVYRWLADFQDLYYRKLKQSQLLSFKDTAELALEMLKTDKDLRRWYKSRYTHIMIDEFQDNNLLQKQLLYLLAEGQGYEGDRIPGADELHPGKLFFVGDEKQSIYRFRGADVSVFKQLSDELTGSGGRSLELKNNYRSDPGLIGGFNRIFSQVMGEGSEPWEATFSPLLPGLDDGDDPLPVTLFFLDGKQRSITDDEEPTELVESEAWYIAGRINDEVGKRMIRRDDGRMSPMTFSDVVILMRTTSSQLIYEKALRRRGIPYRSEAPRSLFLESPANDLYLYMQVIAYPMDRRAYAGLLRSPFCALGDASVLSVLAREEPPFCLDGGIRDDLEEHELGKFIRASLLFRDIAAKADRVSHAELVCNLWYRGGYQWYLLKQEQYHPYLEFYDYIREIARRSDSQGMSLSGFTDMLRSHLGSNEKLDELELPSRDGEGVRIMTVHKAKGLEFPVVILAGAGAGIKKNSPKGVYFSSEAGPVLSVGDSFGKPGKRENLLHMEQKPRQEMEEDAEVKRLFYVAMTRAMQWFVISGVRTSRNGSSCSPLNLFLNAVGSDPDAPEEQLLQDQGIRYEQIPETSEEEMIRRTERHSSRSPGERASWFDGARELTFPVRRVRSSVTALAADLAHSGGAPAGEKSTGDPLTFGSLCHSLIEHYLLEGVLAESPEELTRRVEGDLAPLWDEARSLAESFAASALAVHARRARKMEAELPFVMSGSFGDDGENLLVQGQIDLLLHWEAHCEVIDFKTDRWIAPDDHRRQLELYCEAAGRLTGLPAQGKLYYLRTGQVWDLGERDDS